MKLARLSHKANSGWLAGASSGWLAGPLLAFGVLASAGCQGILGEPPGADGSDASGQALPAPSTRFRRLTHLEWENTVRDLFELDAPTGLSTGFPDDPKTGGFLFASNGDALNVDQALVGGYQVAAASLAAQIGADAEKLSKLAPAVGADDRSRAEAFIENFGKKVHRHPLTTAEVEAYLAIYDRGLTSYEDRTGFAAGIQLVLEAMLQSPFFIYRIEKSTTERAGTIVLDGYERASRLSYFLWATMPDTELFEAAASGELDKPEGVRVQAERMLEDPRARTVAEDYFSRILDVERYGRIAPSATAFPDAPKNLAALAREETARFVGEEIFANGGGINELLTSNVTYVNAELAKIYGLQGSFGSEFQRVELDPEERSGFLTQVGFLASHATTTEPDPIHRGVFVAKRLSCLKVSAPPDMVPMLPAPEDKTNRELVAAHTENPKETCRGCHATTINPYGFTFESYDAIGAERTTDRGKPIDSTASPLIDGSKVPVAGAVELSKKLAASTDVHECMAGYMIRYAMGRELKPQDKASVAAFGAKSLAGGSVRDLMLEIAVSRAFLERAADVSQ